MAKQRAQILLYTTPSGAVRIDVVYQDETVWLTQRRMAELFEVQVPAISKHLKNIFESGELDPAAVVSRMERTAAERHHLMRMRDWAEKLDAFLRFNEYEILQDAGCVPADVARRLAEERYEVFRVEQDRAWRSDFDELVEQAETLDDNEG